MKGAEVVHCPQHPQPPGATWSNVVVVGREVHVSGVHAHPHTLNARQDGRALSAYEQTDIIFDRLQALLEAAGGGLHSIYKLVIYATSMEAKDGINRARAQRLGPAFPCSTFVVVQGFAFAEVDVEIDAWSSLDVDLRDAAA